MTAAPFAVITGASSGIGEALAQEASRDGYALLLVARRVDRLRALAASLPGEAEVFQADLTEPGASDALAGLLSAMSRPPDVLINNAGIGQSGPFAEASRQRVLDLLDLNVRALVALSHTFLPHMLERGSGGILNVASTAAFQPGPNAAVYYASKAFVLSFSEALSAECAQSGVTITALCPGPVETEFFSASGMDRVRLRKLVRPLSAEVVADAGWRGFRQGKRRVIPGLINRVTAAMGRLAPTGLVLPIVKALQSPPKDGGDG